MNPTMDVLQQQDVFSADLPCIVFRQMFHKERLLYAAVGYMPLLVNLQMQGKTLASGLLKLERSEPPALFTGLGITAYEIEGAGGTLLEWHGATQTQRTVIGGLDWRTDNLVVVSDPGRVSGVDINMPAVPGEVHMLVRANTAILKNNLFRLRRRYDTVETAEVLGVGNASDTSFSFTTAEKPICPCSVKINFIDAVGAKVGLIRDNGKGELTTLPPNVLLESGSTINYKTGAIQLEFDPAHTPTATNITCDYEWSSTGVEDKAYYRVNWEHGDG
jgi:hypothetical protein